MKKLLEEAMADFDDSDSSDEETKMPSDHTKRLQKVNANSFLTQTSDEILRVSHILKNSATQFAVH